MNENLQPGMHPDADQLSVFMEGAATAWERERMLAHLAECAECRGAVYLMQPQEEPQATAAVPVREGIWRRWLMPVGLAGAALACGLAVVLFYVRPRGGAPAQQSARVEQPESPLQEKMAAPAGSAGAAAHPPLPGSGSERAALATGASSLLSGATGHFNAPVASGHPSAEAATSKMASVAPSNSITPVAAPGVTPPPAEPQSISPVTVTEVPLNGRNVTQLQSFAAPENAKAAAPQGNLAGKRELPTLKIEQSTGQGNGIGSGIGGGLGSGLYETLSGVSGRITDRSGAVVPGATVTLRDAAGRMQLTTAGADGSFQLAELPAGSYDLSVSARGFKTYHLSISLQPSELAKLEPALDVGAVSETVMVAAAAPALQTDAAVVSQSIAGLPSGLSAATVVSLGKRLLSLDSAGSLFLSSNGGKKWKKIHPQWAGKAVRLDSAPAYESDASRKQKGETQGPSSAPALLRLTTDAGAVWVSEDGAHWRQQ